MGGPVLRFYLPFVVVAAAVAAFVYWLSGGFLPPENTAGRVAAAWACGIGFLASVLGGAVTATAAKKEPASATPFLLATLLRVAFTALAAAVVAWRMALPLKPFLLVLAGVYLALLVVDTAFVLATMRRSSTQ